jgi:hypothetical protein
MELLIELSRLPPYAAPEKVYACLLMGNSPHPLRVLSDQLLGGASTRSENSVDIDLAIAACEKLRVPLARLAGTTGFSMLLARALALATKQDASLTPLRVSNEGKFAGLDEFRRGLNGSHLAHQGGAIILSEFLGLLVSFIGEALTLTLIREAWPDASLVRAMTEPAKEMQ